MRTELVTYGKKPLTFDEPKGFVSMGQMKYSRLLDYPRTFQYSNDLGLEPIRTVCPHLVLSMNLITDLLVIDTL